MDDLDIPLRKGSERSRSNGSASSNPNSPSKKSLHRRDTSWGTGTENRKPTRIISATLPTARSSLNDQLMAGSLGRALSSIPSANQPYSSSPQLNPLSSIPQLQRERAQSGDFLMNPIANQGVELPLANTSMPSLTQLQRARSNSQGTFMYRSNSNHSTPVRKYHQQDELDLRMVPDLPTLKIGSSRNRGSQTSLHDVGLNLDESDNGHLDDNFSVRSRGSYNSSNNATTITDAGIPEPPDSLDDILDGFDGMVTVSSYNSSQMLNKLDQSSPASPNTKKAFTRIHNSSEYGQDISPFLGGNYASNVDLAGAHKSCMVTQQSMLLRSMQSNQSRMQFGSSIPRTSNIDVTSGSQNSPKDFLSQSLPLTDHHPLQKNTRLLKPIQSADAWKQGRRYLIAPAALAACPLSTINMLTGPCSESAKEAAASTDPPKASGAIELGDAFMTYVGDKYHLTCGKWSSCRLVLRQNYLFEYDLSSPSNGPPRGIAHLQHAIAYSHKDFDDALELHFYASPCAKVDLRVLLIRVKNKEDRDHWITCLNKAARLKISDMWDYKEESPLGKGRYASIYPAKRKLPKKSSDAKTCALKIIDKSEFWRLVLKGRERCDTIVRELAVQSTLTAKFATQPTLLQIHGFFETSEKIVIELELLDGRDLFEYISSKGVLEEKEAGLIIRDVLTALNSMNRAGIAHRDIKPANILMTKREEQGSSVKVADFGMSTLVGVDGMVRGRCGSPGYVAPEILKAEAGEGYRNQVDIFSAGVTLYLMLCGYEPFYGETEKALIRTNQSAKVDFPESEWKTISSEAKDLVVQMLKMDPRERISAKDALEHPWIAGFEKDPESQTKTSPVENDGVCSLM